MHANFELIIFFLLDLFVEFVRHDDIIKKLIEGKLEGKIGPADRDYVTLTKSKENWGNVV